jgi:pyruvate/2-oxoglutarate dehydrogenase complex dihydrolipoamide acyltransferase (E2) component
MRMMRVKMKTTSAGPDGNIAAGAVVELPKDKAEELIKGGWAQSAAADSKITAVLPETASVKTPENTSLDHGQGNVPVPPHAKAIKLAEKEGIDISKVIGTGKSGAVTVSDVKDHIAAVKKAE